MGLEILEKIWL